eukprot:scaffold208193_cov37-Attheya_sp.AAC.1
MIVEEAHIFRTDQALIVHRSLLGVILTSVSSLTSAAFDVPKWKVKLTKERSYWRAKLTMFKGKSFTFNVNGWKVASPLYVCDDVQITLHIVSDGKMSCGEEECTMPSFGDAESTRSEYHVHRHVITQHKPCKRMKQSTTRTKRKLEQANLLTWYKSDKAPRKKEKNNSTLVLSKEASVENKMQKRARVKTSATPLQ